MTVVDDQASEKDKLLAARSVELSERAKRLQLTNDNKTDTALEAAANALLEVADADRFYHAQSELEKKPAWNEAIRSLAHEINVIDQAVSGTTTLSFEAVSAIFKHWIATYSASNDQKVVAFAAKLQEPFDQLATTNELPIREQGIYNLLMNVERLLASAHDTISPTTLDPRLRQLRAMRDTILIERATQFELSELLRQEELDDNQDLRITDARETLDEIYGKMGENPVDIQDFK